MRAGTADDKNVERFLHSNSASITAIPSVFQTNLDTVANSSPEGKGAMLALFSLSSVAAFMLLASKPLLGLGVLGFAAHNLIINGVK